MAGSDKEDQWGRLWDAREQALINVLGPIDDTLSHAPVPFDSGFELGGAADVVHFSRHIEGRASVTADLIGNGDQVQSVLGNYELMICEPRSQDWGSATISRLANYTLEQALGPMETMDIKSFVPEGSAISAFLFLEYSRFQVLGRDCGLLLCLGITQEELGACRKGRAKEVMAVLQESGVYPITDLARGSTFQKGWFGQYARTS